MSGADPGDPKRRIRVEAWLAAGLAGGWMAVYLLASFGLASGVDVRRYGSGIYDMDVARVVSDVATPRPGLRTSVHPLQKLLIAPFGEGANALFFDGHDPLAAARVLIALATVLQVLGSGALAWQLSSGSRSASLAATLVCGASFSSLLAASLPESAVFAGVTTLLPLLLLGARWGRALGWGEVCAWGLLSVLGLGLTLTQIVPWAIALAVRAGPGRSRSEGAARLAPRLALALALGGLLVTAGAALQSRVYPGTDAFRHADPIAGEKPWLRVDDAWASPLGHVARLASHFLVIDFVAPFPAPADFLIRSGFDYWSLSAEEAGWNDWAPAQLVLAVGVAVAVAAAASLAPRSDPRLLAPVLCLLWHFALHLLYGREYVLYSPHWHGLLVALVAAGLWNGLGERRRWLPWAAAALSLGLLANGVMVMRAVYREVGTGLEASIRDADGRLRGLGPPMPATPARPANAREG